MTAGHTHAGTPGQPRTTIERTSDTEVTVTRTVNGPAHLVWKAFTEPELFQKWWVPKSMGMKLVSCRMDARVGGTYRLEFDVGQPEPMAFFGTYTEATPPTRLAWTNEEGGPDGSVTSVTFTEQDGRTLVVLRETYPTKAALDAAGTGAQEATVETFGQLDALLATLR